MPNRYLNSETDSEQIRAQCDRILASKVFALSKRQSAFLDYVISAALEGRADKLKEFTLGIDVFEKDESFDPGVDSIVRVEASRLRAKLREYYAGEGLDDSVQIEIPKGHYVPAFRISDVPKAERTLAKGRHLWIGIAIATFIVVLVYSIQQLRPRESNLTAETQPFS